MITAPDRVYAQYRNAPKAVAWYSIIPQITAELGLGLDQIRNSYDIDANVGEQLDVIGRIIVLTREIILNTELPVYQCDNEDAECGDDEIQCSQPFVADDQELSDIYFRSLIKAKVQKNNSDATIEGVLDAVSLILPTSGTLRLIDPETMAFTIEFYGLINDVERALLLSGLIVPKPQGVRFGGFLEGYNIVECDDDSMQCGDEEAQCVGLIGV